LYAFVYIFNLSVSKINYTLLSKLSTEGAEKQGTKAPGGMTYYLLEICKLDANHM